ncbi:DNA polymerase III subunit epsilon [Enterobacteriaceae endosymbiont of Plateumaris consimilis]|uniref:DNA polymerase III subunit epsilon n=1 Tax=Enterobacteriaceae endosymbiont of Plateumaris consimilis TaxID=2675794 RepID=UPI001448E2A4|nr:DNA polymerase III subunit epsilon [Enterobacteriaceae endosymbiont of Plateumaris consimilis]QJC28542.1 DNA polymerase III subunit epsilon [Enterobacteriaceae endosymbiont of Plateumaris consimilis]
MKKLNLRQIVLDTETTGINFYPPYYKGHRIIEIGGVEIINRHITGNNFHVYINPKKNISLEALNIHGITNKFLYDKPTFNQIIDNFLDYIKNSELIIHNAQFDIDFLNYELSLLQKNIPNIENMCSIIDTLKISRKLFPGKRNSLNSLCSRFNIDKSNRNIHGALLDAKLLANVFLSMTSIQDSFILEFQKKKNINEINNIQKHLVKKKLLIIHPTEEEHKLHQLKLDYIKKKCGFHLWN